MHCIKTHTTSQCNFMWLYIHYSVTKQQQRAKPLATGAYDHPKQQRAYDYVVTNPSATGTYDHPKQQRVYDYVVMKPLATGVYDHPVKKSSSNNDIVMDVNPAYDEETNETKEANDNAQYEVMDTCGEETLFANETNKVNDDVQYEVMNRQMNIKAHTNPTYAETKFT